MPCRTGRFSISISPHCSSPASITPTARSTARCSNTAPSCRAACITRASHVRTATTRTAWRCAPRATRSAANATCRRSSTWRSTTITNPAAPARSASTVICRRRPTWSWIAGAITAFVSRGRTCRRRSARRTLAPSAIPITPRTGPRTRSPDGIRRAVKPNRTTATALYAGRTGAVDAERRLDELILDRNQPDIARASALLLLPRYATPASEAAIKSSIVDPECARSVRGAPRAAAFSVTNRGSGSRSAFE